MKLSDAQLQQFDTEGWVFLPEVFDDEEVGVLTAEVPKASGALIGRMNNERNLGQISFGEDWMAFSSAWGPVHRALTGFNLLHYSVGARR